MSQRVEMIGYNRTIKLAWLEYTALLVASGRRESEIIEALREHLSDELSVGSD